LPRLYVDALEQGKPTTQAVAQAFDLSERTAIKRVHQARAAGMLTGTKERQKGGVLTDLARTVITRLQKEQQ
jgi:transposase